MLERLPPIMVMMYPESNVAPMEPMEAVMLMYEVKTPLLDFIIILPIREAQAGATIDVANAWRAIMEMSWIGSATMRRGSQSKADNSPPMRIAGRYLPILSLTIPQGTCKMFPKRFVRERSHPISSDEAPNWTA